jgi:hypothetical protein
LHLLIKILYFYFDIWSTAEDLRLFLPDALVFINILSFFILLTRQRRTMLLKNSYWQMAMVLPWSNRMSVHSIKTTFQQSYLPSPTFLLTFSTFTFRPLEYTFCLYMKWTESWPSIFQLNKLAVTPYRIHNLKLKTLTIYRHKCKRMHS